jgi:hypothetical protein
MLLAVRQRDITSREQPIACAHCNGAGERRQWWGERALDGYNAKISLTCIFRRGDPLVKRRVTRRPYNIEVTLAFYGVFAENELAEAHHAHSNLLRIKMSSFGGHLDEK